MQSEVFISWNTAEFLTKVRKFNLLLVENVPSLVKLDKLNAVNENFKVHYLLFNVKVRVQPMDQKTKEYTENKSYIVWCWLKMKKV